MLRSVRASAKRVLALEPTVVEMCESVTGDPSVIFRPESAAWHATEILPSEYHNSPVEIDRDVRELPVNLCDGNDGVGAYSIESHEGIRVLLGRDLYLPGHRTAGLEEGAVDFFGEPERNDVGDEGRIFRDVNAGRLTARRSFGLSFPGASLGESFFVESTR
jgi:hypothetical protein